MTYIIIALLLLAAELIYFRIADKCNIIDKPNERSSHKSCIHQTIREFRLTSWTLGSEVF